MRAGGLRPLRGPLEAHPKVCQTLTGPVPCGPLCVQGGEGTRPAAHDIAARARGDVSMALIAC